ncbi:hypothetical protein SPURM210S_04364 [Streptomyces purpurascens]
MVGSKVSMITVSTGTEANRSASFPATPKGMARTMTSRSWTASASSAARAPDSSTSARTASGPRASAA